MDKEEAKFILQSFRPDGSDAADPAFAEALAVAAEDREVGEWLAKERAADAAFAAALGSVEIPEDLRDSILAVLAGEASEEYSEMDAAFVGALASVKPPEGLRDQILAAMNVEAEENIVAMKPKASSRGMFGWMRGAAVAAALVLGAFVAIQLTTRPDPIEGALNVQNVEKFAIQTMDRPTFWLDHTDEDPVALASWLEERGVPAPKSLPVGLSQVPGIGCKVLQLNDKKAALICFTLKSGDVVHLVTLDRDDMEGALPALGEAKGSCHGCDKSGWASTAWGDEDQAFLLLGKMKAEELETVF